MFGGNKNNQWNHSDVREKAQLYEYTERPSYNGIENLLFIFFEFRIILLDCITYTQVWGFIVRDDCVGTGFSRDTGVSVLVMEFRSFIICQWVTNRYENRPTELIKS